MFKFSSLCISFFFSKLLNGCIVSHRVRFLMLKWSLINWTILAISSKYSDIVGGPSYSPVFLQFVEIIWEVEMAGKPFNTLLRLATYNPTLVHCFVKCSIVFLFFIYDKNSNLNSYTCIFWGSRRSNPRPHRGVGLFGERDYHWDECSSGNCLFKCC